MAVARLVAAAALALFSGRALPSDFFGPSQGLQIQPELDVFQEFSRDFRLILKVLPTFIPSQFYSEMGAGLYAAWFVAPMFTGTITPDLTRRRRLDVRLGLEWYPSLEAGTAGASNILQAEAEVTPRIVIIPGRVLFTCRNRVEARWQLEAPTSFAWRVRFRPPAGTGIRRVGHRLSHALCERGGDLGRRPGTCGTSSACRWASSSARTGLARARSSR